MVHTISVYCTYDVGVYDVDVRVPSVARLCDGPAFSFLSPLELETLVCGTYVHLAESICAIRLDHMYNTARSYVQCAEIICTICRDHMYNAPRSYVQFAEIMCTMRRDHMYNPPRWYVQFAEIVCTIRRGHARRRSPCPRRVWMRQSWILLTFST